MKKTDMVSFDFTDKIPAYGVIISVSGEDASVLFTNPITREYEKQTIELNKLTKIGNE